MNAMLSPDLPIVLLAGLSAFNRPSEHRSQAQHQGILSSAKVYAVKVASDQPSARNNLVVYEEMEMPRFEVDNRDGLERRTPRL